MKQVTSRFNWIDWMKTIGMYLIILGHFFSVGHKYIYVFSVPLFFCLSGFLSKREDSTKVFWRKIWDNLLFPLILIVTMCTIIESILGALGLLYAPMTVHKVLTRGYGLIIGSQKALAGCWFVYTLIMLKCILQYTLRYKYYQLLHLLLLVISVIVAVLLKDTFVKAEMGANSIINVSVSYPFFILGYYASSFRQSFADFKPSIKHMLIIIPCLLIILMVIGFTNGFVWMYKGEYGVDYLLFIIGRIVGTLLVYLISKFLDNYVFSSVKDLSNGSIIILGFHYYIVQLCCHFFEKDSYLTYIYSLIILMMFVPIIRMSKRYFPILLGRRR